MGQEVEMTQHAFAGFLYGVNIPGGKWIRSGEVASKFAPLPDGLRFGQIVGDTDNLILLGDSRFDEAKLRAWLRERLEVESVVIQTAALAPLLEEIMRELKCRSYPLAAPYRVTRDRVEWELGVVLASDALPAFVRGPAALFEKTTNAVALLEVHGRVLLVEKRYQNARGEHLPWGSRVIDPWRRALRRQGVSVECLTSRSLGRIRDMVEVARGYR